MNYREVLIRLIAYTTPYVYDNNISLLELTRKLYKIVNELCSAVKEMSDEMDGIKETIADDITEIITKMKDNGEFDEILNDLVDQKIETFNITYLDDELMSINETIYANDFKSKNLADITIPKTSYGINVSKNTNGSFTLNGISATDYIYDLCTVNLKANKTYTLSGIANASENGLNLIMRTDSIYNDWNLATKPTYTPTEDITLKLALSIKENYSCNNVLVEPQIELGDKPTKFELHKNFDSYDLLWENNTYGDEFESQTITINNIAEYKYYEILYYYMSGIDEIYSTGKIPINNPTRLSCFLGSLYSRLLSRNQNNFVFNNCNMQTSYGNIASSIFNLSCVPFRILGYK